MTISLLRDLTVEYSTAMNTYVIDLKEGVNEVADDLGAYIIANYSAFVAPSGETAPPIETTLPETAIAQEVVA